MAGPGRETPHPDASRRVEIGYRQGALIWRLFAGIALTVASGLVVFRVIGDPSRFDQAVAVFGLVFFGAITVLLVKRLEAPDGPVVTVAPEGVMDVRIANAVIPWSAVRGISLSRWPGRLFLALDIDPAAEGGLRLTALARLTRGPNRLLGGSSFYIETATLTMGASDLLDLMTPHITSSRSAAPQHASA